jgi:hypothetical protein
LIPPRPFGNSPWMVMDVAWVIFAVGLAGLGLAGWRSTSRQRAILET